MFRVVFDNRSGVIKIPDIPTEEQAQWVRESLKANIDQNAYPEILGFGYQVSLVKCGFIHLDPDASEERISLIVREAFRILNQIGN